MTDMTQNLDAGTAVRSGAVRSLASRTKGIPAQDGDGVKLMRIIGTPELNTIDPFLLLDWFGSEEETDYIGGFPDHPHRGFETVSGGLYVVALFDQDEEYCITQVWCVFCHKDFRYGFRCGGVAGGVFGRDLGAPRRSAVDDCGNCWI